MAETEPVTVRVEADVDDFSTGMAVARGELRQTGEEAERTDTRFHRLSGTTSGMVYTFLAIRGAFHLTQMALKALGIENEGLNKAMRILEVTVYAAIVASKLYSAVKWIERSASIASMIAKFGEAIANVSAVTLFLGTAAAVAATVGIVALIMSMTQAHAAQFGAIVPSRPGGTHMLVGEAGQAEAIIPLGRGARGFGDTNVTVHMNVQTNDPDHLVRVLGRRIQELKAAGY